MNNSYPEADYEKWLESDKNVLDCEMYPECPLIQSGKHDCLLLYLEKGAFYDADTSFAEVCYRIAQLRQRYNDTSEQSKTKEEKQ